MLTEDYNGVCPKCGFDRMLVRYGSWNYFQYDACSKCGFGYGTNHHDPPEENDTLWRIILENEGDMLKSKGFPVTRQGYHNFIMSLPDPGERMTTVLVMGSITFNTIIVKELIK